MTQTKKNKGGRPKLAPGTAKGARVILRLTDEEKGRYDSLAAKAGLTISAWIRKMLEKQR